MSTEQEYAIIGKVVADKRSAERRLALLREQAAQIGQAIGELSGYLRGNVEYVWFDGLSTNSNYPHPKGQSFNPDDFNAATIAQLASSIRDTKDEIKRLSEKARELGI